MAEFQAARMALQESDEIKTRRTRVRNVVFGINLTLDGCCDHAKLNGYDDVHEYYAQLLREVDVLAFGRKTYELMVPFWPDVARTRSGQTKAMNEFAQAFDSVNRIVVFSKSVDRVEGDKATIVRDLRDEVLRLKQEEGKGILIGGVTVPSQLIELGVVDEYRVVVQPIVAGEGRRLLDGTRLERLPLKLVETKVLESGCVALRYVK